MTNLAAVLKATRRSAKALDRMARYGREVRAPGVLRHDALNAYLRAKRDYEAAQAILRANPLPGDAP